MRGDSETPVAIPGQYFYIIFLLSVSFRLILWVAFEWKDHIFDDYDCIAVNILEGNGFSFNGTDATVCRAPGSI